MNTVEEINITVTKTRSCPTLAQKWGEENLNITVTAKAYRLWSNAHPHFSVTADIFRPGHSPIACGRQHEEVLRYFPEMKPLVDLHLSNADDGEPIYGEENGFYWLSGALGGLGCKYHGGSGDGDGGKSPDECLRIFADHCRIDLEEARGIARTVKDKADWKVIYTDMLPRFKREAEAGLAMLAAMQEAAK